MPLKAPTGYTPTNPTDVATKGYVDGLVGGGTAGAKTIAATAAGQWVRFARVTVGSVGGGVAADVTLIAVPDAGNAVDFADLKLRVGQRAAFGNAPAVDIVLMRATTILTANIGWVVVQNTPTTIVDFYVQLGAVGRQYYLENDTPAVTGTAAITWISQEAASTPTLSGTGSYSTDNAFSSAQKSVFSVTAPVGYYEPPAGFLAGNNAGAAMTAGRQTFSPFIVGPATASYDAFIEQVTTAQSGGALTYMISIYGSDANGMPDTVTGPLVTYANTAPAATTGLKIYTFTSQASIQLQPGIYWISHLQVVSTAPTTAPLWVPLNNGSWSIPQPNSVTAITANNRGYLLTGRGSMYMGVAPSWTLNSALDMPYTLLRRSA